jgi:Na+-transporting NADH:ubiquinone oxidoreductase subunit E
MDLLNLFVSSIFIDNMVFAFFLGMCSFIAVSKTVETAAGLGVAVTFIMALTVPIDYLLNEYVLKAGGLSWLSESFADIDLSFLSFIIFIAVIASFTQLVEMVVEKYAPALYSTLGIFLPLIAVNCAILGGSLFMQTRVGLPDTDPKAIKSALAALIYGLGSGLGWAFAIIGISAINEKIKYSKVPAGLRGVGITFIVTGLMGIAFMSFMGIKF